jgi:hypothetical protein
MRPGGETTEISNPFGNAHSLLGDPSKSDCRTIPVPPLIPAARLTYIAFFRMRYRFPRQPIKTWGRAK